ncbi:MAG: subclass B3 metallo-beta-lactamase [Acidobacteria bacterium]|nr:subclass B3 metallo-beta-lactamase [Acidobacteriota bacterium]
MFRRQFLFAGIAASVVASAKLHGAARGQAPNPALATQGANASVPPDWVNRFPPHHIMGNLHYVGSEGLASFLVTTPDGNILINSSLEQSVPLIQASIEKLGFKFSDTKILLISHAHGDHCAGSAKIIAMTGAKYMVMTEDVPVVQSGGKKDFHYGHDPSTWYPPTKVDRALLGAEAVKLGGAMLVGFKTPGHTKGCTTWTMKMTDEKSGKICHAVIVGSPNVNPGYKLVNNPEYPTIAWSYQHAFMVWKQFPWANIVFLGAHGSYYDMKTKYAKLNDGGENPFIDTAGYKAYIAEREAAFKEELAKQQAAAGK